MKSHATVAALMLFLTSEASADTFDSRDKGEPDRCDQQEELEKDIRLVKILNEYIYSTDEEKIKALIPLMIEDLRKEKAGEKKKRR